MLTVAVDVPTAVGLKATVNVVELPAATVPAGCAVTERTSAGATVTPPTVSAALPVLRMVKAVEADAPTTAPAIVTVELAQTEDIAPPSGFEAIDERRYGAAKIVILRATS